MSREARFKYENGYEATDVITGFTGVIMGRADYLTGCNQYALSLQAVDKDGNKPGWSWFDEDRLTLTGKLITLKQGDKPGFDGNVPERI